MGRDFEPYGEASESWDDVCELKLHTIQAHWHGINTWHPCKEGLEMRFRGKTLHQCLSRAVAFLEHIEQQAAAGMRQP